MTNSETFDTQAWEMCQRQKDCGLGKQASKIVRDAKKQSQRKLGGRIKFLNLNRSETVTGNSRNCAETELWENQTAKGSTRFWGYSNYSVKPKTWRQTGMRMFSYMKLVDDKQRLKGKVLERELVKMTGAIPCKTEERETLLQMKERRGGFKEEEIVQFKE